ncbi:phage major capsid protein [Roseomonas elaeocarpi]|uniref:Phage major capsid protein n=1 Tax=Roseomonas elaeocarpi TaxID=907779 RepID=A0ABV6JUC1_9PROT
MKQLAELKRKRALKAARLRELAIKAADLPDDQDTPEEEVSEADQLKAELAKLDGRISALESALETIGEAAEPITEGGDDDDASDEEKRILAQARKTSMTPHGYGEAQPEKAKGLKAARFLIGIWHAKTMGIARAAEIVERRFGDKEVAKALNSAGTTTGGALIPQAFSTDLIELLRAATVIRGLDPLVIPMPGGNMTIPRLAAGAQAGYQGELDDMGVSQETFDDLQLNAKKLTSLVPVSNDLIRRSPIGVENLVRDDLVQTIARREDLAFMIGDGSGNSPIGLLNLCAAANKFVGAALPTDPTAANYNTTLVTMVTALLQGMVLALQQNNSRMIRPAWIMPPALRTFLLTLRDGVGNFVYKDEINAGTLLGFPLRTTTQLPTNLNTGTAQAPVNNGSYLMLADFADVVLAETYNVTVDASDVASYKDSGGNTVSAFQRDQTVMRVISEHDFNIRHQASVAVATVPGWAPTGYTPVGGSAYYSQAVNGNKSAAPSTWGTNAPTGSNSPGNSSAAVAGGTLPGIA